MKYYLSIILTLLFSTPLIASQQSGPKKTVGYVYDEASKKRVYPREAHLGDRLSELANQHFLEIEGHEDKIVLRHILWLSIEKDGIHPDDLYMASDINPILFDFIKKNDAHVVQYLLDHNADANAISLTDGSPLVQARSAAIAELLIDHKADATKQRNYRDIGAYVRQDPRKVLVFHRAGADYQLINDNKNSLATLVSEHISLSKYISLFSASLTKLDAENLKKIIANFVKVAGPMISRNGEEEHVITFLRSFLLFINIQKGIDKQIQGFIDAIIQTEKEIEADEREYRNKLVPLVMQQCRLCGPLAHLVAQYAQCKILPQSAVKELQAVDQEKARMVQKYREHPDIEYIQSDCVIQ